MSDKLFLNVFIAFLIIFIVSTSIVLIVDKENNKNNKPNDYYETVNIDGSDIDVTYIEGNELDINITYGNLFNKEIKLVNKNDKDIVYSVKIDDCVLSNNDITYELYVGDENKDYIEAVENISLSKDASLGYNLVLPKNSTNYVKVSIKTKHENEMTNIKGVMKIKANLSPLELFNNTVKNINDALDQKISDLNGIYNKGYYLLNINNITFNNDANVKGYVLVDANDISDIKHIYTIYNDYYMIKNSNYYSLNVSNVDKGYVGTINEGSVCTQYDTRIRCSSFGTLPKNDSNDKKKFFNNSKIVINTFVDEYDKNDDKTYVYNIKEDMTNNTNIEGYILKNNNDMFLYLKDNIFMIAGYNFTKLGDYDIKSKTIRSYVETAWNLPASSKKAVCSFSGYSECYDKEGNLI